MTTLLIVAFAALCSLLFTPMVRRVAQRYGWVDNPDGRRKRHTEPVPRVGGVAVYLSFVIASGVFLLAALPSDPWYGRVAVHAYRHLVVACGFVVLVGLADDLWGVKPFAKIAVQAATAFYLFLNGYRIDAISNPFGGDTVPLGIFALPVTLVWFVGMSNAFNLIDGLDGLAAGIGLFSTTTLFIAAAINERWEVTLLCSALGGALLGFLRYNFFPANIFLGDSGSLLIGFALAAFAIRGSMKSSAAIAVAAPLLALAIPIVDAVIAILRRLIAGKNPLEADGDHIHHRLLRRGWGPRSAVVLLYAIAGALGALSLLTMNQRGQVAGLVIIATSVVTWLGIQHLGYPEFGEIHRVLRKGLLHERQAIGNNVYLRSLDDTFAAAQDLESLWAATVEMARRIECHSVELCVGGDRDRFLWREGGLLDEAEPLISWTIPLGINGTPGAVLVLTRRLDGSPSTFDSGTLAEVLQKSLVPRFVDYFHAMVGGEHGRMGALGMPPMNARRP
jgi:UDP-GlcNAc:undecaprenyl-phosphate GlcNAc-1-phosphate transferase